MAANVTAADASNLRRVPEAIAPDTELPDDSGTGRRVVYSEGLRRVWLVDDSDQVESMYAVSGSVYDNLDPGTFAVYSRSEHAAA